MLFACSVSALDLILCPLNQIRLQSNMFWENLNGNIFQRSIEKLDYKSWLKTNIQKPLEDIYCFLKLSIIIFRYPFQLFLILEYHLWTISDIIPEKVLFWHLSQTLSSFAFKKICTGIHNYVLEPCGYDSNTDLFTRNGKS